MEYAKVSLLDSDGNVQYGLNWGKRDNRDPNQAYLQLTPEIYKSKFFPEKGKYFIVETDDNKTLILNRAQKGIGTALQTPENNALLGLYIRSRLGIADGLEITKEDVIKSGITDLFFFKKDDLHYTLSVKSPNLQLRDYDVNDHIPVGTYPYLRAMRTKPFLLLAGISGTGKSRIVKQMAFDSCPDIKALRTDPTSPGNYCLIEVKPNWHDSTELLGYESNIGTPHYQLTPFIKFLVKAMLYPATPFFVCLDEMNLAPVEQYFAEFLSVLESRTKIDGHIVSEPLVKADIFRKHDLRNVLFSTENEKGNHDNEGNATVEPVAEYGKVVEVYDYLTKHGLRIPENVIVIGTVNMDETTHQFSRKVIDRAMTIEMNLPEGDPFMDFFNNSSDLVYRSEPASSSLYLATETKASDVVKELAEENAEKTEWLKGEVANFLKALNSALNGTPFKVAYRVQNELMLYFHQLWLEDRSAKWGDILNVACDQMLMMKVLPRIEGDDELLEKPLAELLKFSEPYTNANRKVKEMSERLERSRFTSFWP